MKKSLPEYMIPYAFFEIDEFPLNSNGKLDLQKLRQLSRKKDVHEANIVLSDFEKKIIKIWEDILEINISENDMGKNFYELGADSLSVVRFISEIEPLVKKDGIEKILLNPSLETIKKYKN